MIELARAIDSDACLLRTQFAGEVGAPITAASAKIAAARLNYGTVQGWIENGMPVPPFTHLGRAFERAPGSAPFKIPDTWWRVKEQLDLQTPFCISTTSDIVGGNSGSPLIDAESRIAHCFPHGLWIYYRK